MSLGIDSTQVPSLTIAPAEQPRADALPFFLVGSVRSGTTLLRLLLGHHPQIARCEEFEFVMPHIGPNGEWPDMTDYLHKLRLDRNFRFSGYTIDEELDFPALAHSFIQQRREMDDCPVVGATVHEQFDRLIHLWPEARYIFLNRDPRDVARSCVNMGWAGNTWGGAVFWQRARAAWRNLCHSVPAERRFEICFEDLVVSPERVLTEACHFLDIEYSDEMLTIEKDTTYSRPNSIESKSWLRTASVREVTMVEARIGLDALTDAGYEASGFKPLDNGAATHLWLTTEERVGGILRKIRKFGLPLWAAAVVTRRLPVQSWRDGIQLRIDQIINQQLK